MVQSLELILDDALDAAVRSEWQMLLDAGLPSQARHTGSSNRPHVTLSVADDFDRLDSRLATDLVVPSTVPIRLGAFVVFHGRSTTLARLVVPSVELLDLHARVSIISGDAEDYGHTPRPGTGRRTSRSPAASVLQNWSTRSTY